MNRRTDAYKEHIRQRLEEKDIDQESNSDNQFLKMILGKPYKSERPTAKTVKEIKSFLICEKQQEAIKPRETD